MSLPARIAELVQHFTQHIDSFKSSNYNETRARIEFIDPFFKELGWDIENTQGFAETYKDVIHEDAIKVEGSTKAPDYSFRIGGQRKFFLEAKKPSVNVKDDLAPAYQLRRYAWNAGLPVSILTDFEEFAIYDTTIRPNPKDKASTARIFYCTYKEYEQHWEYISSIFSKDAILKGSFDQFARDSKKKKGTTAVDKEFLREMEKWRNDLAKNIALRNTIDIHALNYVVQATIDRILFLRICEDRNIEEYGRLQKLASATNIYKKLTEFFEQADEKYNSGLFHFHKEKENPSTPDEISLRLKIDDKILKEIITALYFPSPYEFSVISADILGNVYEQFLGKVIRLTSGGQAKVEEKPEVKKAGGVYYTPQYIVKYIVENTVGELLKGKTPIMVAGKVKGHNPLRILDPACGSGSFLIYAYQYLLDWHRDWYEKDIKEKGTAQAKKWSDSVYQGPGNHWYLTTREKKQILLNNIFGVDIDHQAVEVTKLNLLLKVLEGENRETLGTNLKLFQERALPDLSRNIKCGNSLIGSDSYGTDANLQKELFNVAEEEQYKINAFDWHKEFPEAFEINGFDAVIGNPPYGGELPKNLQSYIQAKYKLSGNYLDTYFLFMEHFPNLVRANGHFSLIVPNTFCDLESASAFRTWLLTNFTLESIWETGFAFESAVVDTLVFRISNIKPPKNAKVEISINAKRYSRSVQEFIHNELCKIDYRITSAEHKFLLRLRNSFPPLGEIATLNAGVKLYEKGKGSPPQTEKTMVERPYTSKSKKGKDWLPLYRGGDINRYKLTDVSEYVNYGPWLAAPRSAELFKSPKILMRRTDDKLRSALELENAICVNSCHVIRLKAGCNVSYEFVLGLLNSRLIQRIFEFQNPQMVGKVFSEIKVIYVERLPINTTVAGEIAARLTSLVGKIIQLTKEMQRQSAPDLLTKKQRQIEVTEAEIDGLVYELYGLTEAEVKIVAGGN